MKKNNKINLFVLLMLTSFIANAMQPDSSAPPTKKRKGTEILEQPTDSPVKKVERVLKAAQDTPTKIQKHLEEEYIEPLIVGLENTKQTFLSPGHLRRRARVASGAQRALVMEAGCRQKFNPASTDYHHAISSKFGDPKQAGKKRLFAALAQYDAPGAQPSAIRLFHTDHAIGKHFFTAIDQFNTFVQNNATGPQFEINPLTQVTHIKIKNNRTRTILKAFVYGLGNDDITEMSQSLSKNPYVEQLPQSRQSITRSLAFYSKASDAPIELITIDGEINTAYPIFSFVQWQPNQASIIVAPIEINNTDRSIVSSSNNLETLANHAIGKVNNAAVRYIDRQKIIIDLAKYFHNQGLTDIVCGIYVEFPLNLFNINILQANFPEFFHP